jgi:hypothetical protein
MGRPCQALCCREATKRRGQSASPNVTRSLEPKQNDGYRGHKCKGQLREQHDQALPWRRRYPSNAAVRDERQLGDHEELPEVGLRSFVSLRLHANRRDMGEDEQERERRHDHRKERTRLPEQGCDAHRPASVGEYLLGVDDKVIAQGSGIRN